MNELTLNVVSDISSHWPTGMSLKVFLVFTFIIFKVQFFYLEEYNLFIFFLGLQVEK